jgi:circadian clock protein KaiB
MYEFKLYVVGQTQKSLTVVWELTKLLKDAFGDQYNLEVIDIIENPEQAEKDRILATPTLEKVSPEPVRRIVGDLSDKEMVLPALGLTPQEENKQ